MSERPPRRLDSTPQGGSPTPSTGRLCTVCGTKLSTYNPGPNCWQHTIGYPWRGPTAKPKYEP
jgi:hypothetical protein